MEIPTYLSSPIPLPPRTQALNSPTFTLPPLNGTLTPPELYDFHLQYSPNHPLFVYTKSGSTYTILWSKAVRSAHRAGRIVQSRLDEGKAKPPSCRPIVSILALSDSITYSTTLMGIIRAGYTVFPISPRNSAAAVAHLLSAKNVTHMLVGEEKSMQSLAKTALELMKLSMTEIPKTSLMPLFEDIYIDEADMIFQPLPPSRPDLNELAVILHSSGSTSFPKPIPWTHRSFLQFAVAPFYGKDDLTGMRMSVHALSAFHAMGILAGSWQFSCGLTLTAFEPVSPAVTPTPESVIQSAKHTESEIVQCVPSFAEAWALSSDHVVYLKTLRCLLMGGGSLNKEVGDSLVKLGVPICIGYGSTETGLITVIKSGVRLDWEYFEMTSQVNVEFDVDNRGLAEAILAPGPRHAPSVFNAKRADNDVYATGDLLLPHPEKPGYWKYYGRTDDQIVHNTGEKTNPVPLEKILDQDPLVISSIMFGQGRFNAGVLVDPIAEQRFDPVDATLLEEFRNKIWPTVQRINTHAPQHSRLFKEMVLVSSPSKPFAYTAKGTPRRQAILNDYKSEIEALYATIDETAQLQVPLPANWSNSNALEFVRAIVSNVMNQDVGDDDDFFQHGCDSLQATWIRNILLQAMRSSTQSNTRLVPMNVIYENPTISALAAFVSRFVLHADQVDHPSQVSKVQEMLSMVEMYSQGFPQHSPSIVTPSKDVVMITGTTGALGAALLAEIVASDDVDRVFAVNRKSSSGAMIADRQMTALKRQGLDPAIAYSPKVVLLEADLSASNLGLLPDIYEPIRLSVTHIIHVAWHVDFNVALRSFEPQVKGVRNLIDLALASPQATPPRLLYTSSIGVLNRYRGPLPVKEGPVGPESAVGTGYSESKWVSERLLELAFANTALNPIVIRVGQICGGPNGFWNEKEWLPSLIRSSIQIKCLPYSDQKISWIPLAIAAKAITEMRLSSAHFIHLTHPHPVLWSDIFGALCGLLAIPIVPYSVWLSRLEASGKATATTSAKAPIDAFQKNPALHLIEFFRCDVMGLASARGIPPVSLDEAQKASETLRGDKLVQLGIGDVKRWVDYWRSTGFILQ
ncbi:hypothetical protein PILCRDRAFT_8450 [Piloderma croceum F 1598]|uniref:Polyketide synthase-like phosphopantetheine-binding domain-containing protein n=1 Tax=Piloderma croceum (strain F 1598) TaxID=765440 RepID=A0A0C3BWN2_PILCF|nr:hypothetical protein PILCRDRAFT_8450 [Piloderma croceum F 1598]